MASTANYSIIGRENDERTPDNMGRRMDKFLLLMWKNFLLQYRKPIQTIIEIIAPVIFSILLVLIRSLVDPEKHDPVQYKSFCTLPIPGVCPDPDPQPSPQPNPTNVTITINLAYSPQTNYELTRIMNIISALGNITLDGYNTSEELEQHFVGNKGNTTLAGIQLDDSLGNRRYIPDDVEILLRFPGELRRSADLFGRNNWHTNLLYPVYQMPGPREPNQTTGASPRYYREGFLTLQTLMGLGLILVKKFDDFPINQTLQKIQELDLPLIKMQRYPYASWIEDYLLQALQTFVSMIVLLSFVYPCINTVKMITTEKEKQLKEAMKIMGLPNWLHWTAWFVKTFVFLFISVILIVVLLKVSWYQNTTYTVFTYANPSIMLLFLTLYICATITFCFAISVFFSKANTAATIAGLLWFLSYAPYLFMQQQYDRLSLSTKLLSSLGANTAMSYGFQLMLMYEGTSEGIQWNNIWRTNSPDDNLTLGLIMIMLIIDCFLYLLIALYVEAVFPGDYGVPKPWYFPFMPSFWRGQPHYVGVEDFTSSPNSDSDYFEHEPEHLKAGIQIRNLRKVFKKKAAVRNLSLNMYEGQITVLLGHNGAGKTTTMSMLTGMLPPTSGTATINGNDIRTNMENVRSSLGLCPQHNILFDELTVREHLYFFSKLKGLNSDQIENEIQTYINLLELQPKAKSKSSTLSGGMKRKLCVGIALCGNSSVVMLDEPTAGMDPSARRALWDLLQKQKFGRTILLTTHFMDEADLLGDRIAIMAGGILQCCGSSFFLKKKYGAGYHLIMDKSKTCNPQDVTTILQKHIPNIEIHSNIGSELTYILAENQVSVFEEMLQDIERNSDDLGINSYGISLTTLEEVFMKVGADYGQEEIYNQNTDLNGVLNNNIKEKIRGAANKMFKLFKPHNTNATSSPQSKLTMETIVFLTGSELIKNQYMAMFMKKILSTIRTWILQLIQIFMPVAFLIIAIVVIRNAKNTGDLPKLHITLDSYKDPVTVIQGFGQNDYGRIYSEIVQSSGNRIEPVNDITKFMLNMTAVVPSTVRRRYIVGASYQNLILYRVITAWFNNDPYHSPPLALGLVLNTLYKKVMNNSYNLRFANYPLPYTAETKVQQLLQGQSMGFQLAFNLSFSMAFVSSFYVLFYVRERVCKSKHLQFVSGVKVLIFWTTSYICDLLSFMVTATITLITLLAFQEDGFRTNTEFGRMFLIMFYFGFSMIPMLYLFSYCFKVPATGYTRMTLFSIFTGVSAFLVVQVLGTKGLDLEYVADTLNWIFLVVPHYSLATGIRDNYMTFATNKMCKYLVDTCVSTTTMNEDECWDFACYNQTESLISQYCCQRIPRYFKWESPGIGRNLVYSFSIGVILFTTVVISEYRVFTKIKEFIYETTHKAQLPMDNADEDSDVMKEKIKIRNTPLHDLQKENILILRDLTKYYGNFLAVNGICLGVKKFECFGLLGVNGAGKTTTFKMMTGDVKMTYGDGWVMNHSLKHDMKNVQKHIGYCPQFDALLDDLTAKETLIMFGLLRGIPLDECDYIADKLAKDFDFKRHLNKQVKQLSGGNKRKLSTAISLIGDPPVIYLDEPTTGMDPATKRFLWNALCQIRDNGKCVVLTSHSMEECEALCTRLAIMVNGNFKCLGSTQHLKSKFAEGYTLIIKLKKYESGFPGTEPIERFILDNFPKAIQREKHQELLTYYIVDKTIPWSRMFGILEQAKRQLDIEDYSLGQSSLEQVFLTFTKHQR